MIQFEPITLDKKSSYEKFLFDGKIRGCEYTFTNLYTWGIQKATILHDHLVLFSQFGQSYFYPYPIGTGDKKQVLDALLQDALDRNISYCITGLDLEAKQTLEKLYPNKFYFRYDRKNFDYVYAIDALADLKGRKFHRKRNHLKHFKQLHPNYSIEPIQDSNIQQLREFIAAWYLNKSKLNKDSDFSKEQAALEKALLSYDELDMDGVLLIDNGEILAFTMGSPSSNDTFDVHYEKAFGDMEGAYTAINSEFAKYLREKYSHIEFLNREEDMGIMGLRKAKLSYFPHHLIEKYCAYPLEMQFDCSHPTENHVLELRALWKEAFGDSDSFLDTFYSIAFSPDRCFIATHKDKLAAALYTFDCSLSNQSFAYVYAVATASDFQHKGACHVLLNHTRQVLKEKGYKGLLLVPATESLMHFYEGLEYKPCTKVSQFECASDPQPISIREIDKEEYSTLRREFLPNGGVIQEGENIDFLKTQMRFYTGENFLLAAYKNDTTLHATELLGDASLAPQLVHALDCNLGTFRTPGKDMPFAMFLALAEDVVLPEYFGLAFD